MDKDRAELIDILNESISAEYGALFMLPQHMAQVKDADLKKKLQEISRMELEHAEKTAQMILALGGQPVADIPSLRPRNNLQEILEAHLEGERQAIDIYTRAAAKCRDPKLKEALLELKKEEEEHQRILEIAKARLIT
ncbi:MAG: hypothetical protein GTO55_08655 [Armatimonadetes bacterium]|nr:hypothetical protein [Armatimonadota bacterium]NIM24316.1 hypothetical protein [Armatimonadota bacterium]NIM68185.1 hypothetical protein [Armatimonadota bacterium]NIM76645.1 hypothetical protein [Armatimonadota bacterium]NIN06390.1 hypothetical protein [Armatimonadota bacterium]